MFGFGPMSSFYDEDFEDGYNPVEPFSQDEFVVHNNRELRNLDAGRDDWGDGDIDYDEVDCPDCGAELKFRDDAETVRCRNCGSKFRVNKPFYAGETIMFIDITECEW